MFNVTEAQLEQALESLRVQMREILMSMAVGLRLDPQDKSLLKFSESLHILNSGLGVDFSKSMEVRLAAIVASRLRYHNFADVISVLSSMSQKNLNLMSEVTNRYIHKDYTDALESWILELSAENTSLSKVEHGYDAQGGGVAQRGLSRQLPAIIRMLNLYTLSKARGGDRDRLWHWIEQARAVEGDKLTNDVRVARGLEKQEVPWVSIESDRKAFVKKGGLFAELLSLSTVGQMSVVEEATQSGFSGLLKTPTRVIKLSEKISEARANVGEKIPVSCKAL